MVGFEVLKFTIKAGFRDVLLEGDNLSVMNAVRSYKYGLTAGGAFMVDIR